MNGHLLWRQRHNAVSRAFSELLQCFLKYVVDVGDIYISNISKTA